MSYLIIEIKDPKARKLLNDLRDRNLISIDEESAVFFETVRKIKKKTGKKPGLSEISLSVAAERSARYAGKKNKAGY